MAFDRASKIARFMQCQGSHDFLDDDQMSAKGQEAADWGHMLHTVAAGGKLIIPPGRRWKAKAEKHLAVLDHMKDQWQYGTWEQPWAYNLETKLVKKWFATDGDPDAWKKSFGDDWITGSSDFSLVSGRVVFIDDLKTGVWAPPPTTPQLMLYGLCITRYEEQMGNTVDSCLLSVYHLPRVKVSDEHLAGQLKVTTVVVSREELAAWEDKLQTAYRDYKDGLRALETGDECRFCPGRKQCRRFPEWEAENPPKWKLKMYEDYRDRYTDDLNEYEALTDTKESPNV